MLSVVLVETTNAALAICADLYCDSTFRNVTVQYSNAWRSGLERDGVSLTGPSGANPFIGS
jgi:hypothetical protein